MFTKKTLKSALLLSGLIASSNIYALDKDEIIVGGLISMTGAGSVIGEAFAEGTKMAVEEINANGGVLDTPMRLVLADTQTNPSTAVSEVMRLVHREKIDALIGPAISQETGAVVPLATRSKLFQISSAGSLELTPEVGPYHFSIIANAEGQGIAMVNGALDDLNAKRPAILVDNGGQSRTAVGAMKKRLEERGVKAVGVEEYQYNTDDVTPQLLSLREQKPDVILYFIGTPGDLRTFLENRENIGWDVPVVGAMSMSSYAESIGKSVPGNYFDNVYGVIFPEFTYCPGDELGKSLYAQFYERYKERGIDPEKAPVGTTSYYYSSVYLLKDAIENTNSLDAEVLANWIETESSGAENMYAQFDASKDTHFMFGPDSLILGQEMHNPREDKTFRRYSCD